MKNFIISQQLSQNKVILHLKIKKSQVQTRDLPDTVDILAKHLPSIFTNSCFNGKGLCFYDEVQNTEVGHLFEHILLEYMCLAKIPYQNSVSFEGRTFWNNDTRDLFRIEISCSPQDWTFFNTALAQGVFLMDTIYASSTSEGAASHYPDPLPIAAHVPH